jgi:hypothetical protein
VCFSYCRQHSYRLEGEITPEDNQSARWFVDPPVVVETLAPQPQSSVYILFPMKIKSVFIQGCPRKCKSTAHQFSFHSIIIYPCRHVFGFELKVRSVAELQALSTGSNQILVIGTYLLFL